MRPTSGVRRKSRAAAHTFRIPPLWSLSGNLFLRNLADLGDADFPDETHRAEGPEEEPRRIELVPGKTMTRRSGVGVVIVVPALAECHERDPPQISGIVRRGETPAAPHVRGRVHQPG